MSGWISVKDKLPDVGRQGVFAIYTPNVIVGIRCWFGFDEYTPEQWIFSGVTHWMPLPEPPESGIK